MRPTWITFSILLVVTLAECGRGLYMTILQQWVEESELHIQKEINAYQSVISMAYQISFVNKNEYCYKDFAKTATEELTDSQQLRTSILDLLKDYTPSLCYYKKDLYFFDEPDPDLPSSSILDLVNMAYACGKEFSVVVSVLGSEFVDAVYEYTIEKIFIIERLFQFLETKTITPSHWCNMVLEFDEVSRLQNSTLALETLSERVKSREKAVAAKFRLTWTRSVSRF